MSPKPKLPSYYLCGAASCRWFYVRIYLSPKGPIFSSLYCIAWSMDIEMPRIRTRPKSLTQLSKGIHIHHHLGNRETFPYKIEK